MRVACVLVTRLRAKVEMRRRPDLEDRPAVIVGRCRGSPVVVDCFPAAAGVAVGMTPEQALSRQPDGILLEADEAACRREFRRQAALQGVSDRVEGAELGTAYVGLDGLEAMYGGEARPATALLNAVPQDLAPRGVWARPSFPHTSPPAAPGPWARRSAWGYWRACRRDRGRGHITASVSVG